MRHRGFSLVELSIVLVILGLLTGGILAGQSLIRGAELRAVTTEYQRYVTAVGSFRDKYFAVPGDFRDATKFWKAVAAPATCAGTASSDAQTCDGDGDGRVSPGNVNSNESFRFWQHLANAGLIEGSYDGIAHGSTIHSASALNSPRSRINNALWYTSYLGTVSGNIDLLNGAYDNMFTVGAYSVNTIPYTPILKPEEMWNIDTKMDDGKPGMGKVGFYGNATVTACSTAADSTVVTADYRLNNTAVACAPLWRQVY